MTRLEQLLEQAMALPDDERLELAQRIEASVAVGEEPEWLAELERRADHALQPDWQGVSVQEAHTAAVALAAARARVA